MAAVISEFARAVVASDVFDGYGFGSHADFLHDPPAAQADWIITNPPFNLACEFTLRALDLAADGVATRRSPPRQKGLHSGSESRGGVSRAWAGVGLGVGAQRTASPAKIPGLIIALAPLALGLGEVALDRSRIEFTRLRSRPSRWNVRPSRSLSVP
jgi:hypothetical protein